MFFNYEEHFDVLWGWTGEPRKHIIYIEWVLDLEKITPWYIIPEEEKTAEKRIRLKEEQWRLKIK